METAAAGTGRAVLMGLRCIRMVEQVFQPALLPIVDDGREGDPIIDTRWLMRSLKATRRKYRRLILKPHKVMLMLYGDRQSILLERILRDMHLDDALVQRPWRLEYVMLETGFPHYRLYRNKKVVGIRDITSPKLMRVIAQGMAAYLAQLGFRENRCELRIAAARTALDSKKHRLPPLFLLSGEDRKGRKAAHAADVYALWMR
jgi:hypothetical protein